MRSNKVYGIFAIILFAIISVSFVSAYRWACLGYGESIPYYTCYSSSCKLCLNNKGYSTSFGYCRKMPSCSMGPPINDTQPPALTINSPSENQVFNSRKVIFDININEPSSLYYIDNVNGRGRWSRLSSASRKYVKAISFKDGLNNITIKATDRHGNYAQVIRNFYVDSKKPKVNTPKFNEEGYLTIDFEEANPVSLALKIGNAEKGYVSYNVDIKKDCNNTKNGKYSCSIMMSEEIANLIITYNGEYVEAWIELKDIAGNIGLSKKGKGIVDLDDPVINNPNSMFKVIENYVHFNISITEKNFRDVSYFDNSATSPRWQKLCVSLKNGLCYKKVNFSKGNHVVDIRVSDETGNIITKRIEFEIK